MVYRVTIQKRAIKALEKINDPYYSNIKDAIYGLAENPRPIGCKKLKAETVTESVWLITVLFMTFWMICL